MLGSSIALVHFIVFSKVADFTHSSSSLMEVRLSNH
jgi:hypothetical protein